MIGRRQMLGAGAAALAAAAGARAQAQAQAQAEGYGTPAGVAPFGPDVFRERRRRVMEQIKTGVAVIYGADAPPAGAVAGAFVQDADFAYLTGIMDEPGAAIVLAPAERTFREFLFLRARNPEVEIWDGERLPLGSELERRTGFQRVRRIGGLGGQVVEFASRSGELHFLGPLASPDAPVPKALDLYGKVAARVPGTRIVNNHNLLRRMRTVKEARELELMRHAVAATRRGLEAAMRQVRPGMREHQLKAIIEAEFRAAGARGLAFPSIVGAGRNAAVLHYTGDDGLIRAGDLVVCDVGAAYGHYAADVTRTFPVDGRFTPAQREVYETVLRAQEAAAAKLRAGVIYEDLNETARDVIRRAGRIDAFLHGLGHFVGLDVHDAGDYAAPLPAGAVLTIEPGIYLADQGFGVRIEDEYLVTAQGNERLSAGIPRTVAEIEAFMRRA